ncbi:hypothetical protein BHE90_004097 [Fusarium euwallaceae]|uniref:Uncharacterized protein n=1 Tax=Fusarium euwallaceae TaxID=1147111 RepID=A0A430M0D1_9HYPO|nr:hypothetical protein BHE90_004097 [Fusarium euwallaceae]
MLKKEYIMGTALILSPQPFDPSMLGIFVAMGEVERPLEDGVAMGKAEATVDHPEMLVDTTESYASSEQKFDIVVVHGLGGLGEKSWSSSKHPMWIKDLAVRKDWQVRIIRYSYFADDITEALYPEEAISVEAERLLQKLAELRSEQQSPLPLAFFAHDVGGIIVKQALVLAGRFNSKYADIRCSTRLLMFFGCPHRTVGGLRDVDGLAARLGFLDRRERKASDWQMKSLARSIITVNSSFLQTRMLTRANVMNIVSSKKSPEERIFDYHTATFGTPLEKVITVDKPHTELDREPTGENWHTLYGGYQTNRVASFPWYADGISPFIETIESQAAPVYPPTSFSERTHHFSWLSEDETFKTWREARGVNFLHIHGTPDVSDAAEYVFREVVKDNGNSKFFRCILYFKFDKHDARRNSIGAMANTFLSQILGQVRASPAKNIADLEPPDFTDCWTDKDAFFFLDKVRRDLGYASKVHWILDGLDQCDESSRWFLSELSSIAKASEQHFKIVITSVDGNHICQSLPECETIDLTQHIPTARSTENAKQDFLSALFQKRPQFYHVHSKITHLLESCGLDNSVCSLLLEWLTVTPCASTRAALEQELESLMPLSPARIFEKALNSVRRERRQWAKNVLTWVTRSARPLSLEELASALTLDAFDSASKSSLNQNLARDIQECFGPLIFSLDNGAVQLRHSTVRDVLTADNGTQREDGRPWYVLDSPEQDHRNITDACVRYLSIPAVQEEIRAACKASSGTQSTFESPSDILSYTIQYWPHHYQQGYLAEASIPSTSSIAAFFQDEKALQCWAAVNWHFLNPCIRADQPSLPLLAILASLGLKESVATLIKSQGIEDKHCVSKALNEASRHGKEEVVKLLLQDSSVDESTCLDAIMAAARSAEFGVLDMLLRYATEKSNIVQWPGLLASRLASLGPVDQLKTILETGGDANLMDTAYSPPLHCAIIRNSTTVFDVLVGRGADPAAVNSNWKDTPAILVAAKYGHMDMVRRLAEAGASVDVYDNRGRCALWVAASTGQHLALKALLAAGANKRALEVPREESVSSSMVSIAAVPFSKCLKVALEYGADPNCKVPNGHPSSVLSVAATWGFPDICRMLLEAGADHDSDEDPPLIHAVVSGNREIVDMLLEKGAKIDVKLEYDGFHATPLIIAARRNYKDWAKIFIDRGASVDLEVWNGSTALHYAISGDHPKMVKFLIDSGANTGQIQDSQWSALQKCYPTVDCTRVLLDTGVDLNWANPEGTALYLAAFYNELDVAKLILSYHPDLEIKCPAEKSWDFGYTALHVATSKGFTEMVRLLVEAGADLNSTTPIGGTPLILAVANDSEDCTKALLEYDLDLDTKDVLGFTALHCVPSPGGLSIAKLLVNRGASLEIRNNDGRSVLDLAIMSKDAPLVEFLLDKKADINAAANSSGAALHVGASMGDIGMVKLLVREGADVNLAHPWMYGTALQKVYTSRSGTVEGRDAVARFLVEEAAVDVNAHGGVDGSALEIALLYRTVEAAKFLIERGADVGWKDPWGRRPVHFAALRTPGHFQLLLDSVSDMDDDILGIDTKTNLGQTPLHFAVASGSTELVELILSRTRHKIINEPDEDGWTPLLWACRPCNQWGTPAQVEPVIVKLLLDRGADPSVRGRTWDDKQWSPLEMARYHGATEEVVQLLKKADRHGSEKGEKDDFHASKKGVRDRTAFCDMCLFGVRGMAYMCSSCDPKITFCFKCCRWKEELHPHHNNWSLEGTEFEETEENEAEKESPDSSPEIEQVQDDDAEGDWSSDEDNKG